MIHFLKSIPTHIIILFALIWALPASAQRYVVDPFMSDSVQVSEINTTGGVEAPFEKGGIGKILK